MQNGKTSANVSCFGGTLVFTHLFIRYVSLGRKVEGPSLVAQVGTGQSPVSLREFSSIKILGMQPSVY